MLCLFFVVSFCGETETTPEKHNNGIPFSSSTTFPPQGQNEMRNSSFTFDPELCLTDMLRKITDPWEIIFDCLLEGIGGVDRAG